MLFMCLYDTATIAAQIPAPITTLLKQLGYVSKKIIGSLLVFYTFSFGDVLYLLLLTRVLHHPPSYLLSESELLLLEEL